MLKTILLFSNRALMIMSAAQQSKKAEKPAAPPALPTYNVIIKAAIGTLKERKGSLHQAIIKYIRANYKVSSDADSHVRTQLPKLADVKKELTQTTGKGFVRKKKVAAKSKTSAASSMKASPKKFASA